MPPYKPPASGKAPLGVKRILRKVYTKVRKEQYPGESGKNKAISAAIAWNAVKRAGWRKLNGKWVKKRR